MTMSDPTIIAAAIAGAVSLLALIDGRLHRRQLARTKREEKRKESLLDAANAEAQVIIASIGDGATVRAQLHEWLEQERARAEAAASGHRECLSRVTEVEAAFLAFRAEHPDCAERIACLTERVASLEAELGRAAE